MNYIELFSAEAKKNSEKVAVVDCKAARSTTYAQLDRLSSLVAGKIHALGYGEGDFIILNMKNCMEYTAAWLGTLKAGCAVVPVSETYPEDRVNYIAENCGAKLRIKLDFLEDIERYGEYCAPAADNSPALVIYTSGSTGNPKGVCHSAGSLARAALRNINDIFSDCVGYNRTVFAPISFIANFVEVFVMFLIGNTIHILPDEVKSSTKILTDYFKDNSIDVSIITPQLLRLLKGNDLCLKRIDTGSEAVCGIYFPNIEVVNIYGQSETLLTATYFRIDKSYEVSPIGKALNGLTVHILDENGNEVPDGVTGELCIEGDYDVKYLNDPEKTNATFVKLENGNTLIHTGDNGYKDSSGNLNYVSRKDWMVKINGQRVETMEVERKLNAIDAVDVSAVKAWTDLNQQTYIAGYYQANKDISENEIRRELSKSLPGYMIPRFLIRMDELPKNLNGKLDRKSLPEPDVDSFKVPYRAPETKTECLLCDAFSAALNYDQIGADDDFFMLGGDSIKVLRLLSALDNSDVTADMVFVGKTPAGIAALLNMAENSSSHIDITNAAAAGVSAYPLTPMECGMYLEQKLNPESVSYNLNFGFVINGADEDTICDAVRKVFLAHEALHSYYGESDGALCRILTDEIPEIKKEAECSRDVFEALMEEAGEPFNLENSVPARLKLYPLGSDGYGLHIQIHHIAFDATSAKILSDEFFSLINGGRIDDNTCDLYAVNMSSVSSDNNAEALAFYDRMFENGVPANDLPMKCPRPKKRLLTDSSESITLNGEVLTALKEKATLYGVTVFELMLSVYATVLGQYCASDDIVVSIPVNMRKSDFANVIGMFVNSVPVRVNPKHGKLFSDYVSEVSDIVRKATRAYNLPFETLVNRYCPEHDESRNPLFDMGINYIMMPETCQSDSLTLDFVRTLQPLGRDIALVISRTAASLQLTLQYSSELFDKHIIENFLEQYQSGLLLSAQGNIEFVNDLTVLPERQLAKLESFSSSGKLQLPEALVHRMFEKAAQSAPERTALIACDKTLTFEELNRQANQIAWNLISRGVKRGDSIVLLLPRRSFYFAAALGVLKTGAAFIPCDPEYPADRIRHITDDSEASYIITTPEHMADYPADGAIEISTILCADRKDNPDVSMTGEDLAYMIYTSGSTGKPKGVLIRHIGVSNYFTNAPANILYHQIAESGIERILCITTVSFDMSMKDSFGMLCNGKTIIFANEEQMNDPIALTELMKNHDIHAFSGTPSRLIQYMEYPPFAEHLKKLKMIVCGAEAYPSTLKERLSGLTDALLFNTYGPTEITISSNMAHLNGKENVSVGRPLLNVVEYIVDKNGDLVPEGVTGELYIGGPGVAKGYKNLQQQTEEHFVEYRGGRFYRSGDYAKWDSQGNVLILGRMDSQVKLRGLRIELGEIEGLMETQPGISKAVVAVRRVGEQEQLCAWYTSTEETDIIVIREELKQKLPSYMVPAVFTPIDSIPVTANGKINMKALPEPVFTQEEIILPQNEMQQKISDIVSSVIGTEHFGIDTDLFSVGLTSINSVSLSIKLTDSFSVSVQIRDFRENNTVIKLEKLISGLNSEDDFPVYDEYAVTKIQEGIFFEMQTHPGSTLYNIPGLIVLNEAVDTEQLKLAVVAAVEAHPYLKVRFFLDEQGKIRQKRMDSQPFTADDIQEIRCNSLEDVKSTLVKPYNLLEDRLFRVQLIITEENNYLFFEAHHIIYDGHAKQIMMRDISRAYAGEALAGEICSGFEASLLEEKLRASSHYDKAKSYYTDLFADVEADCVPIPDSQDSENAGSGTVSENRDVKLFNAVSRYCAENGVSENAFYTAAFGYTLAKFCGRADSVFATINNGRNDPRFLDSVSMFVRTYPVLCKTDVAGVAEYIKEISRQLMDSLTYDVYSFEEISSELGISADIIFAYQGQITAGADEFCGLPCEQIRLELDEAKSPLEFMVYPGKEAVTYQCSYRKSLYTEDFVRNFIDIYEQVISEFLNKTSVADINLISDSHKELLDSFNNTETEYDIDKTVVDLFREQVKKTPEATAVIFRDRTYTYLETDSISDRIAVYLINNGIKHGDVVSVLVNRSEYMPLVSLGVLKAGCAYQPLDPSYPVERLAFMVSDSAAKLLIADSQLTEKLPDWKGKILLTEEIPSLPDVLQEERQKLSAAVPEPGDLFILLYTSGSTGTPKGAMLEHANINAFCNWYRKYFDMDNTSCAAAYASYGFDANMMDMYPILTAGGRLLIVPEDVRLDMISLNRLYTEQKVTHAFITTQVGRQFSQLCDSPYLKHLSVGGEALVPVTPPENFSFYNCYGPTECTIYTTAQPVTKLYKRIPIGKPLDNMKLYVVDKEMHRLPVGVPGELCISGHQVSRGYLNLPEKTASVYVENPFDTQKGYERMYRSGDIVRLLSDGTVDFIGRNDGQVKIRGFRIEVTEVEEIIRRFEGISDATVVAFDAPAGGKELAAYIVSPAAVDIQKLKEFIRAEKPAYMVPAVIMQIDKIPLNQNQKVNRRALPKPELSSAESEKKTGVLTECEKLILAVLKDTAKIETTDVTTELVALGMSSISAISFVTVIEKKFGVDIPVAKLLQGLSVMDIENEIMLSLLSGKAEKKADAESAGTEIRNEYPLTQTQLGVYYETMQRPESILYNVPFCLKFKNIDSKRLCEAVKAAVKAHPFLNTHVVTGKDGFLQVRNDNAEPVVNTVELGDDDLQVILNSFVQPFDLHAGPLYRFSIINASDCIYLLMDFHHLVFDGFSFNLFINSLKQAYETGNADAEQYSYFDYSLDEEAFRQSDEYAESEKYYKELLCDFENTTEIPADISGKAEDGKAAAVEEYIDAGSVETFCKENRITPSTLFLASAFYTVSRFAAAKDVYISTISNGRAKSKTRGAVGMFVRTLPIVMKPEASMTVMDYIEASGKAMNGGIANEMYPFMEIAGKYGYGTDIMYECQLGVVSEITVDGQVAENILLQNEAPKFKLKIVICDSEKGICLRVGYNDALYSEKYMKLLARSLRICTERMITDASAAVKQISLLSEEDTEILENFSHSEYGEIPGGGLIHKMFESRAAEQPDKVALVACDGQLTYSELNTKANIIANALKAKGVGKGDMIVLLLPRRSYYFAAVLGVLKVGAAFIPCDPQYPADRIRLITEDSDAQYIVTTQDKIEQYESGKAIDIEALLNETNDAELNTEMAPEDLAYAIYTSGSTGKPKGVLIRHIGVCNYFADTKSSVLYNSAKELNVENVLCITTISFDMSMKDGLGMLCNGKKVIFADEDQMNDPVAIAELMEKYNVELFSSTPSRLLQYLDYSLFEEQLKKQKIIICGAEMYPSSLMTKLRQLTDAVLFNSYGPTEITVSSNMANLTDADHVSVGKPLYNYTEFIVDADNNLLPVGVTGELYVGGPGVAKGYNKLEEMTREHFVEYRGMRVYKTGDYARWDEEGNVIILGRKDNQVKLRGLRIELGEIESLIAQYPSVKQALVLIKKLNGQDTLCAYYTASENINPTELRDSLKTKLTHYMVPGAYLQLDSFPVNANGKTDRKALPDPVAVRAGDYVEASNEVERFFCDVFADTLNMEKVGAEDNFFECGGSSLTVTSIVVKAVEKGYKLSYSDVFAYPTPRMLAEYVTGEKHSDADSEISDYDYTAIHELLSRNTIDSFRKGEEREIGNILLTGATGYMGTHVLHHFLMHEKGKVYCLLRKGRFATSKLRLKNIMFYYFGDEVSEEFEKRVESLSGDVTDYSDFEQFEKYDINTVFNCAANVKHFSAGTDIEDINIGGVENCIRFCKKKNARLIHFSTISTAGNIRVQEGEKVPVLDEHILYMGQSLDNKYTHSKFIAERKVFEAILDGLDAKVIRVGTLAPRKKDGEFQINFLTNSFMGRLRTYSLVGAFPYNLCQHVIRMGAIDVSTDAFMRLAKTPSACCLFNACNSHTIFLSDIISYLRERGRNIRFVEQSEFNEELMKAAEDPAKAAIMSSLLAYVNAEQDPQMRAINMSCTYTNDILTRMDFLWDITDEEYIKRFLSALDGLYFFDTSNLIR